ncbi:MAG: repressor LexA [Pelagibacteraceae bacterium]|nr:repressor LexA [Pelagibacteraceae bacterium]|tara:strand:+ start:1791 stop:2435 length:645 start_codon:yes stop_codon:yes gene_type:complete
MLTKKQKQLLDYLTDFTGKSGISPSFEEMKEALNLKSKSGIHRLITSLEQRGFIKRLKHKARAMEVIRSPEDVNNSNNNNAFNNTSRFSIPILGDIAAGNPIESISSRDEHIDIPQEMISKNHNYFGLLVKGESMVEKGILDGDIAVIKQKSIVDNGKIAAVLIRKEEVTLKKINFDGSLIKLIPANPAYKEKIYSRKDIEVYGELTGIIRKYN